MTRRIESCSGALAPRNGERKENAASAGQLLQIPVNRVVPFPLASAGAAESADTHPTPVHAVRLHPRSRLR